jgi:hypothetical protein
MNIVEIEEQLKQLCGKKAQTYASNEFYSVQVSGHFSYLRDGMWKLAAPSALNGNGFIRFSTGSVSKVVSNTIYLKSPEEISHFRTVEELLEAYHVTKEDILWEILREKLHITFEEPCNEDEICRVFLDGRGVKIVHLPEDVDNDGI